MEIQLDMICPMKITIIVAILFSVCSSFRVRRQAMTSNKKWTSLNYCIHGSIETSKQNVIRRAAAFWRDNTCLRVVETCTTINYIRVFKGTGCYSSIGQVGGVQDLSMGEGCDSLGTMIHEFGHALGMFHTQCRKDRNNYVLVREQNILNSYLSQFQRETAATNNNYGLPYDFGSIMHYGSTAFTKNGLATLATLNTKFQQNMGSRTPSFIDIFMVNKLYGCNGMFEVTENTVDTRKCPDICKFGGFPTPKDCSTGICPSGYGGPRCGSRPPGCGAVIRALAKAQKFTLNFAAVKRQGELNYCNYWLQVPVGRQVQVIVNRMDNTDCGSGCYFGGIEIKSQVDQRITGIRNCCPKQISETYISNTNLLPVIMYSSERKEKFTISFRAVGQAAADEADTVCEDTLSNCTQWNNDAAFCSDEQFTVLQRANNCKKTCALCGH